MSRSREIKVALALFKASDGLIPNEKVMQLDLKFELIKAIGFKYVVGIRYKFMVCFLSFSCFNFYEYENVIRLHLLYSLNENKFLRLFLHF